MKLKLFAVINVLPIKRLKKLITIERVGFIKVLTE